MAMSQARELAGRSVSRNCSPCNLALTFANAREWTTSSACGKVVRLNTKNTKGKKMTFTHK